MYCRQYSHPAFSGKVISLLLLVAMYGSCCGGTEARGRCNIDVRKNLSVDEFLAAYYLQRPVIIEGFKLSPRAAEIWDLRRIAAEYGEQQIAVGSSRTITKHAGSGHRQQALAQFVEQLKFGQDVFAFEKNPHMFNVNPEFISSAQQTVGPILNSFNRSDTQKSDWYFSLASQGSGVHAHYHSDGWAYIFEGSKRWFFWPPFSSLPPIVHVGRIPMKAWYERHVYPQLLPEELPLECHTHKNDFIYVPESYWHATITTSPYCLAVASQVKRPVTKIARRWKKLIGFGWSPEKKSKRESKRILKKVRQILQQQPNNAEAWLFAGSLVGAMNKNAPTWEAVREEVRVKEIAFGLSPRNCDAAHNYALALAKARQMEKSISILRDALDICGGFHVQLWQTLAELLRIDGQASQAAYAKRQAKRVHREL